MLSIYCLQGVVPEKICLSVGLGKQKIFVLSGLLSSEAEKIVKTLNKRGMKILKRWEAEETWQTILGSNRLQ